MVAIALSFLAIKINIALEISINSFSSTDRGDRTSDFKTSQSIFLSSYIQIIVLINQT